MRPRQIDRIIAEGKAKSPQDRAANLSAPRRAGAGPAGGEDGQQAISNRRTGLLTRPCERTGQETRPTRF